VTNVPMVLASGCLSNTSFSFSSPSMEPLLSIFYLLISLLILLMFIVIVWSVLTTHYNSHLS
jgi:hypothetical protein